MNEKRIQQVIEVEKQAQALYEAALKEADRLPRQAEAEAQALVDQARRDAEEEVRRMLAGTQADEDGRQILLQAEEKSRRVEQQAASNFDRAVAMILARVTGEE